MRLTLLLLLCGMLQVSAHIHAQTSITYTNKSASLEKVFTVIKKQTGYMFFYREEDLANTKTVSVSFNRTPLEDALKTLLKDQGLQYNIQGKAIFITRARTKPAVQESAIPLVNIKGRILNENGEPVTASVIIKGTNKGTTTNAEGYFELAGIDEYATLLITGVSIESFEVKTDGRKEYILHATNKITQQQEVVVQTGYQKIRPQNFVGSYAKLDSAAFHRRAGMDIIGRLEGTVAGMLFDKKGADPKQTIQIRGLSTLARFAQSASPEPLIIVDNFPFKQNLSAINPNDVESITVLKDAAAASIWGAQAGNGVIVITTKKGRFNQPLQVSITSNTTIQEKPDLYAFPQMDMADFIDAEIFLFQKGAYDADLANNSTRPVISPVIELLAKRRAGLLPAKDSATGIDAFKTMDLRRDLDNYVYRPAILQQHYLSVSGGSHAVNYSLSAGYNCNLIEIKGARPDEQFTINSRADLRPLKNLELSTAIYYSQSNDRSVPFSFADKIYPYAQLADLQGNALAVPTQRRAAYADTAGGGQLLDWRYRPLEEHRLTERELQARFIQLNAGLNYKFTPWLQVAVNYQHASQFQQGTIYYSPESYFVRDLVNKYTNLSQSATDLRYPIPTGSVRDASNNNTKSNYVRGQLNFNKTFAEKHAVTALVAGELSETKGSGTQTSRVYGYSRETGSYKLLMDYITDYPMYDEPGKRKVPTGLLISPSDQVRLVSFLSNFSYSYDGKYSLYASARKDGANIFGVNTNKKWKPLWSVGGSWEISKESFYRLTWMPSLRLRASYGYTGNPGNGTGLPTIRYNQAFSNLTNLPVAIIGDAPNPDLRWEKVGIANLALDFRLLTNRLSGSVEVFRKKSSDIISLTPFPPSTGINSFITNVANLQANGFEIQLSSKNIEGKFSWQTNFALSHAKTVVTKLYTSASAKNASNFVGYGLNLLEGQIAYGLASYRWEGLDPQTGDPRGFYNKQVSTNYAAIMNDSLGNQVFHGSSIPLYSGFLGNAFSWKNFTLSANISYRLNFYFRKPTISYSALTTSWQGHADYAHRWQKPGDEKYTNIPSFTYPLNSQRDNFYERSSISVLRGDNIRWQDLRLQYSFDQAILKRIRFHSLQAFLYINNLNVIIWRRNQSALDPDFTGGGNFITPPSKSWTGGISLGF